MKPWLPLLVLLLILTSPFSSSATDPLPSWNHGTSRQSIIDFVTAVTDQSNSDYVAPNERVAVFDNDGTLWSEQPAYFQLFFVMDRIKKMAAAHPEWKTTQPFQAVLEGDMKTVRSFEKKVLMQLLMTTHTGMTTDAFSKIVKNWLKTARHPTFMRPYTELVYQPMLELLEYLRANDFKTYIVSGGGIAFMRPWAEEVYGIPPEQVIGSSIVTQFEIRNGEPVLIREAKINFIDDKKGKPVAINLHIGRRPIFAFGNSDGDLQMLQWTTLSGGGRRFAGIVHHTDQEREFAYDKDSRIGRLDQALLEASKNGWTVVDMKNEWKVIYP